MKFFCLFFNVFFILSTAAAQVDPAIHWKVQEDDHAVWIYDQRHRDLVKQYAKQFRRLYPEIQKLFHEVPPKTTFVIADITDRPNGSATVFPYPMITIYPVIPLPNSPIGETDDSFYEILAHEYTHILNLYPVHGGMRALSYVFGSIVRPNGYLPRWYTEGLAVFTESYFNPQGGRLRSQNFEGMVRALHQDKSWNKYSIDTLNDSEPDWIGGRRAYLLGGALMYEVATTPGLSNVDALNQDYSRRLPYFINGPVTERTQKDYEDLLSSTYARLDTRAEMQQKLILTAPVSQGARLDQEGFYNYRPVISPDGQWMVLISRASNVPSSLLLMKRDAQGRFHHSTAQQIAFAVDISDVTWSPDSQKIVYNSVENYHRFYEFSDLRAYDVKEQKSSRLTFGARAGDMGFSRDGKKIYFVQNIAGAKRLSEWDLDKKSLRVLYTPERLGSHLFSVFADDTSVYFFEQLGENRQIKSLNLASKEVTPLFPASKVSFLRPSRGGYLFTSSVSGVDNLYWTDKLDNIKTGLNIKPLTNSLTRVLDGAIDPHDNALYYSEQKGDGYFLLYLADADVKKITTVPTVPPLMEIPSFQKPPEVQDSATFWNEKEENFSPWPYLLPRYWMPFANVLDGGISFQASTGASDPLGKNSYSLMAEWDTLTTKTGVTAGYVNTSTPVALGVSGSQMYRYNYSNKTSLRDSSGTLSASYNIPFMFRNWTLGVNWKVSETEFTTTTYRRQGPSATIGFNNAIQRGYEISPETGMGFSLSHQAYIESLGNLGYNKTNINLKTYFSRWLPTHNVLFFQLNGTYAPELKTTGFYTSTLNGNFFNNLLIPPFLVRGYNSGTILGKNMLSGNLEYRFPIARIFSGWDTIPFFIKRIHGAMVADAVSFDGGRYSVSHAGFIPERFGDEWYVGYGAELNAECTLGYYLPVTLSFGVYRGANRDLATDDVSYFFVFKF